MALPSDPFILLSYVNTKLRDQYASLEQFCDAENADRETVCRKLATINYVYNKETNSFQ